MKIECGSCKWSHGKDDAECRRRSPGDGGFPLAVDACGDHDLAEKYKRFCLEAGPDGGECVLHPNHARDDSRISGYSAGHVFAVFVED